MGLGLGGAALGVAAAARPASTYAPSTYAPSTYTPAMRTGAIPTPTGYSQRGALEDCARLYRANGDYAGAARCEADAARMSSMR